MPRNWADIPEDELLNFDGAHTGQMAQFDRIMQKRTQESLSQVQGELSVLSSKLGHSTDRLVGVGNRLIKTIEAQAESQNRHQRSVVALTVVIALATVAYTWITWLSVQTAKQSIDIQASAIAESEKSVVSGDNDG